MQFNQQALNALEDSQIPFLFLTGKAGTGKSTLVREWVNRTKKRVIKLAPTGIAAMNITGTTIHKFFNLNPPKPYYFSDFRSHTKISLSSFDVILIDEVSMVRSDIMQVIYNTLTYNDILQRPWGGKLIRVVGDLSQLPPVVADRQDLSISSFLKNEYGGIYFFDAPCFKKNEIAILELTQVYRQDEVRFLALLDFMRSVVKEAHLIKRLKTVLGERVLPAPMSAIWLCTTKARVAQINTEYMKLMNTQPVSLKADIEGKINVEDVPVESEIHLKVGCRVMIRANDQNYVNGEMGIFTGIEEKVLEYFDDDTKKPSSGLFDCLVVETDRGTKYVRQYTWESIEYVQDKDFNLKERVVGRFAQHPVVPAYAMTIHKSQGLTLSQVHIDFERGCFSPGQAYVAISRCTKLEGITFQTPVKDSDFRVDPDILKLHNYARQAV